MTVRRRLTIFENQSSRIIKINLFFLAGELGLSGWVANLDGQTLRAELQGEEKVIMNYIENILKTYRISNDKVELQAVKMDKTDDGSVKIG